MSHRGFFICHETAEKMYDRVRQFCRSFEEYATLLSSFLISSVFYRRKDFASAAVRRIAVIKLDHIGDVILSIPVISNLRAYFPRTYIAMVVNSSSKPLADRIPYADEVLCYDARFFDRSGRSKMLDFARGIQFAREMRGREFDLIVDLRGSFALLFFAFIAKSRYRIDRGTYLVHRKLGRTTLASEHEAEVNLDILARAGIPTPLRRISLRLVQEDLDNADSLLEEYGKPDPRSAVVVIHPGGPTLLKRWPAERYAQLALRLLQKYRTRIVLVGDKRERQVTRSVLGAMNGQAIDLSGRTTLGQLTAVMRRADLFIGNDSGPMHLASACGTRVIGLFGPTSPQRFGPYGDHCAALRMEKHCHPCMRNECKIQGYRCIDQISVNDVMEVVEKLMSHD